MTVPVKSGTISIKMWPVIKSRQVNVVNEHDRLIALERDVAHIDKTLSEFKTDVKSEFSSVRGEIRAEISGVRGEVNGLRAEMNTGFSEVNRKFDAMQARIDKNLFWTLGMFGAGVLGLAAFMYFLFSRIPIPAVEARAGVGVSLPLFSAGLAEGTAGWPRPADER